MGNAKFFILNPISLIVPHLVEKFNKIVKFATQIKKTYRKCQLSEIN